MNNLDTASPLLLHCPFQISPQPLLITEELGFSEPLHVKSSVKRTIFFTPVIIKYLKKNLDITKPRYREQICQSLQLRHFVKSIQSEYTKALR